MAAPGRLSIFVPTLSGGGAERVMATLANGFARRGHPTDLVLARRVGPFLSLLAPEVRVVDLGKGNVLACLPALVRYLRRERPQALLSAMSHANVVALLAGRLAGGATRIVVSERVSYRAMVANARSVRERIVRFLMRRLYHRADAIAVVSAALIDELAQDLALDRAAIHMVPNPVVNEQMLAAAGEDPDCAHFEAGLPVILGAGRLTEQKDFETLLRAFALLRTGREARLIILGEGPERAGLERLAVELGIAGDVAFPGFKDNPFAYMGKAALFVLSSRLEGMPGVLIQAMACGTPVVSTDCDTGPREVLEGGRWGALVPVGDARALSGAMAAALDAPAPPDVRARAMDFAEAGAVEAYLKLLLPEPMARPR